MCRFMFNSDLENSKILRGKKTIKKGLDDNVNLVYV